jgi:tRNA-splicing ligase RtcB
MGTSYGWSIAQRPVAGRAGRRAGQRRGGDPTGEAADAAGTVATATNRSPGPAARAHNRRRTDQALEVGKTVEKLGDKLVNWASVLEEGTRKQAETTATMPFIYPHLALMPDAHLGLGATVGSVIPTLEAIIPAAVGVDIGCGMIAVRTQFVAADLGDRNRSVLRQAIERAVPLSAGKYNKTLTETAQRRVAELSEPRWGVDPANYAGNWPLQLGTLGSGNHFIEVSLDEEDRVWLFLHSGSRGVGNKIAQRHIKVAQEQTRAKGVTLPDRDLAYLTEDTDEFWAYLRDLQWAQHFALLNREEMMDRVADCMATWMGQAVVEHERINCHHNFSQQEEHFGKTVWLSRKGAIEARTGQPGLIPGSMGTASYVVVGKGNRESLNSSPHGAGRNFSRTAARKKFTVTDLREAMTGIEYRDTDAFLDEHPLAYKDIDIVMEDARDLVEIRHTLRQIVNVKGD